MEDIAQMKSKYTADVNLVEATNFKQTLDVHVKKLKGFNNALLQMHSKACRM